MSRFDQYYGRLLGNFEWIFRQSEQGSVGHIVVDATEYLEAWNTGEGRDTLRIDTWCGRNYKFNATYSVMKRTNAGVRNACEYCFVEYDPNDQFTRLKDEQSREVLQGDLPF